MPILDPVLGGKARAIILTVIAVLTWLADLLDIISKPQTSGVASGFSVAALLGLLTHFTSVGNKPR